MNELSPAAQAVLDAYWNYPWDPARQHEDRGSIAAALRAIATQEEILFDAYDEPTSAVRIDDLLAIVAELEGGAS